MENAGPSMDLSGKLIIKVQLGDDIRRIPIHNEDITYDELVLMMQRVYRGKLSTQDDIVIKYKDEDGDLITIFDSSDLTFAIQCSRILKITLFVNGKQSLGVGDIQSLRKDLQAIRNSVNAVLDHIDTGPSSSTETTMPVGVSDDLAAARVGDGKEFDPLSSQQSVSPVSSGQQGKVTSSTLGSREAPAMAERAGAATPDSLSSIGSSASHNLQRQQQQQGNFNVGMGTPPSLPNAQPETYAAAVSQGGHTSQGVGSATPAVPQGQPPTTQPTPAQYPPPAANTAGQAPPTSTQYSEMSNPAGQYAQPAVSAGQGMPGANQFSQSAHPAAQGDHQQSQLAQQYPAYAPSSQGYSHYAPAHPQPQQQQQGGQGMVYGQGTAPPPSPGQPQPQPQPQPPQAPPHQQPASGYPTGAWNMQSPGQPKAGSYPPPPGPGQTPGGSPNPAGPNPYSRAPGYGAGYPRPAPSYQQTYQ